MRQFFSFVQALGQFDAADGAGFSVFLPAAAGEVAAHDGFDFDGGEAFGDDGAFFDGSGFAFEQNVVHALAGEVVGHDVREFGKPEVGDLGKDFAFARDGFGQDDVEGGKAVGGDDEHGFFVDFVEVAHFAGVGFFEADLGHGRLSGAGWECIEAV